MKRLILISVAAALLISACGNKTETAVTEATEPATEAETGPDLTGLAPNPLTGLYIDEEDAERRPVAVMINNNHKCLPQSGIAEADILYETLAEGEITRILAVFQTMTGDKIGPVRSAREYYTTFALDHDAIFVHHGGSPTGYAEIRNRGVDNLDGMNGGAGFFRDKARMNAPGMYEHSSYIESEGLAADIAKKGYETERSAAPMFTFSEEDRVFAGEESATDVVIPFTYYQISEFKYDPEAMEYLRYQTGEPQIDEAAGETLRTKNILIQFTDIWAIPGDSEGRREMTLVGKGSGRYITNGKVTDITWEKDGLYSPTEWYDGSGKALELNKGKTWILVCPIGLDITYTAEKEAAKE